MALDEVVLFYHFSDTSNPKFHFLCDPHFTIHNKNVGIVLGTVGWGHFSCDLHIQLLFWFPNPN